MIVNHFSKYSKAIAWLFVFLFWGQMLLAARTSYFSEKGIRFYPMTYTGKLLATAPAISNSLNEDPPAFEETARPVIAKKIHAPETAFTTGPTQPEMQSYQSVNVNNMVDLFSGDFSYNIPLMDVGGYPVNLHYQSGISMDQEASWVGLGWNINPGTISRNMRGLPDDFNGTDKVTKTLSMKENKTLGLTIGGNAELLGFSTMSNIVKDNGDSTLGRPGTLGLSLGIFHNNYKGWGTEIGLNAGINSGSTAHGAFSGGLSITNNSQNGLDVSPSFGYQIGKKENITKGSVTIGTNFNSRTGIQNLQLTGQIRTHTNDDKKIRYSFGSSGAATISFSQPSFTPTISIPFTSEQYSFTAKVGLEQWAFHPNFYTRGYSAKQYIKKDDRVKEMPSYGYLYYQQAKGSVDVLLDFNREKDVAYRHSTPHVAIPVYTYDTYSITGEGTGGMFRPYRGDVGFVYDHALTTRSSSGNFSIDFGVGSVFHGGVDIGAVYASTKNYPWLSGNTIKDVTPFMNRDSLFEEVYFKNPGEKTSVDQAFYDAIGDDKLVRVNLTPMDERNVEPIAAARSLTTFKDGRVTGTVNIPDTILRQQRSKRTQVISYLTASEAAQAGLDRTIRSYQLNSFPSTSCSENYTQWPRTSGPRLAHHLSEITVLNPDGRRYIYGLPVYNISSEEVSFSTGRGDTLSGLVNYDSTIDNTPNNNRDKEAYFNKEEMPGYAHSFLLSGILSPDYVDVTSDGITEDDLGDAVKFNYTQVYAKDNPYKWRAPYQQSKAAYNEGLKTDSRDEKGSYSYGTKEVWYMNSIESKTMIATFKLETDSVRLDSYGVNGENGGRNNDQKLYRLKEINLYTKADFLKNGSSAKPIKTVHFEYNYELCRNNPGSVGDTGKLTLKKVWFTYNKNNKGKLNPYVFSYHQNNPGFSSKQVDRWGNYKKSEDNPGATGQELANADYPYTLQQGVKTWDSTKAANNVAAWTLSSIKLPSGGKIDVSYEADDYAYVQDRRAMQFFEIAGFAATAGHTPSNSLYEPSSSRNDYRYVFVNIPQQVNSVGEIKDRYLEGVTKLFFRLFVKMPDDRWGKGYEYVPCYADIVDYGIKGDPSDKKIWIQVAGIKGESPMAIAALQFLRMNLPSKAYPYSEPGDGITIKDAAGMLASAATNVVNAIGGFGKVSRSKNVCNRVLLAKTFVRLNNPYFKKFGGGLRVKRVRIYDSWHTMTANQQQEANYGMEYNYTTTKDIRGVKTTISSGVATYEPAVGNDENPFRLPVDYVDKVGALAPADYMYTEEPFGETFFPSPSVGYSKVTVQTIHKDKKSANGLQETEFYTARDFPVFTEFTALDDESKKPYNPRISNILRFNSRHYVTISQGFKVELNDMHGKMKAQSSYAQTDLEHPISYTLNYYKLQNDNSSRKKLSNTVAVADSASGVINPNGQLGKDIEIMIDIREQQSSTISGSFEANVDVAQAVPPIVLGSFIPMLSSETNRFRSIALLKVVNRYAILDSVVHFEKGSKVSTRNAVYDGETGEVLLSQTNNEFDDPVYNFSYPAHWAYTGMGPAYKNIGAVFNDISFRQGKMFYSDGLREFPVERYFESGDELLVYSRDKRVAVTQDVCSPFYYFFTTRKQYSKIWALDASKGHEAHKGIYFIDKDGKPFSAVSADIKIIRSGKRNMSATPVGTITSLKSPVKTVSGKMRFVFDSTSAVIASGAAKFKDLWKVDSTTYAKDTVVTGYKRADSVRIQLAAKDNFSIALQGYSNRTYLEEPASKLFEASSYDFDNGEYEYQRKSWAKFDFSCIPKGAVIKSAILDLPQSAYPQINRRVSNSVYIKRVIGQWVKDAVIGLNPSLRYAMIEQYFEENGPGRVDESTKVQLPATTANVPQFTNPSVDVTGMAQAMLNDYHASSGVIKPSMMIRLLAAGGATSGGSDTVWSRMGFTNAYTNPNFCSAGCGGNVVKCPTPKISIVYYVPCSDSTTLVNFNSPQPGIPQPGYYCVGGTKDSFLCKPNISDTAVNPYRWGILGNWRMDRAYTYYDRRMESDPNAATNIRTNGQIKGFVPYWAFTNTLLEPGTDSSRWVWNSEMVHVNRKGFEIENRDPLGRHNSGLYGYGQTLPIAVAQNSKAREMMFEGFEDFSYRTDTCKRCQDIRFSDIGATGNKVDTVSHTGKYSLRVPGNGTISSIFTVSTLQDDTAAARLSFKVDSTPIIKTLVTGAGTGLKTEYRHEGRTSCTDNLWEPLPNSNVNIDWEDKSPEEDCFTDYFFVRWNGFIQPRYSGVYTFYVKYDDEISVVINGVNLTTKIPKGKRKDYEQIIATDPITLVAGQTYSISVLHYEYEFDAEARLYWESNEQAREIVPFSQLYEFASQASGTVTSDTTYCVKVNNVKPSNITLDRFTPLQGSKIVVGAWVRQETPCVNGNYEQASLEIEFNSGTPSTFILKPKGNIIEGWQRIEDTLTIPLTATSATVRMKSTSSDAVFFDDLRIHPYHSNMKSFVYNSVNIRLMAELDENNYATFYEYDDDGTLIRVKKETERGIKTIRETRSALFKDQ
jgi:hypothetical protein